MKKSTILRIEKLGDWNFIRNVFKHNHRLGEAINANSLLSHRNMVLLGNYSEDEFVEECKAAFISSKNPKYKMVQITMGVSKEYFEKENLHDYEDPVYMGKVNVLIDTCFKWSKAVFGNKLKNVVAHLDETVPHLHLLIQPLMSNKKLKMMSLFPSRDSFHRLQKSYGMALSTIGVDPPKNNKFCSLDMNLDYYLRIVSFSDTFPEPTFRKAFTPKFYENVEKIVKHKKKDKKLEELCQESIEYLVNNEYESFKKRWVSSFKQLNKLEYTLLDLQKEADKITEELNVLIKEKPLALGPDIQTTLARLSGQKKHPYQSKPQVFNLGNGLKIQSSFLNWRDIDRPLMEGNDALSLISYVRGYNNDFQWEEALKELNDWNKKYNVQRSLSDLMSKKYAPTFVEKSLKSNYSGPKTTEKTWHKQEKLLTESFKLSLSFVNSLHNEGYIRSDHRGNLILSSPKIIKKMKDSSKEEQNVLTNTDTDYPDYDFYNNPLINAKDLRKNPYRHTSINQEESHIDAPLTKTLAASLSNSSRKPSNEKEMEEFIEACMEECFKAYYAKNKIPQKEVTMEKIITSEKDMTRLSEVPKDDEPLLNYFRTSIDNLTQDKQSYFVSLNVQKEPFFLPGPQKYLFLTLHPTEALVFKYRHPQYNCIAIPRGDLEKCLTNIKDFLKDFTIHIAPMEEEDKELLLVKLNKLSLGRNIYDNKDNGKSFLKENSTPREINFSIKHSTKEISEDLKKKQNITSTPRFN